MESWMANINSGFVGKNADSLIENLRLTIKDSGKTEAEVINRAHIQNVAFFIGKRTRPEDICSQHMSAPFDEIAAYHLAAVTAIDKKDWSKAFLSQSQATSCFIKFVGDQKEQNWFLDVLYQMLLDLRRLARVADKSNEIKAIETKGKSESFKGQSMLERAADIHMQSFRTCVADNRTNQQDTKKWGILFIVNQLFKIYFMINKLHLLKPLIRAVEASELKNSFPLAQRITYNFFRGRKALFENDYQLALQCLEFAFNKCHQQSAINQRQILLYLIPVKLIKGIIPTEEILIQHNLEHMFSGITKAMRTGDLHLFDDTIEANSAIFIKTRTLLTLEKLRVTVQRSLFRKTQAILGSHLLPLGAAFDVMAEYENEIRDSTDMLDELETECIISGLIAKGFMKGYIAHSHKKIVMSKKDPFPSVVGIAN